MTLKSAMINELVRCVRRILIDCKMDAFLVPTDDAHLSEYVAECDKRREFITGFTGSAGTALITAHHGSALWVDGRYHLQAEREVAGTEFAVMKQGLTGVPSITKWLSNVLHSSSSAASSSHANTTTQVGGGGLARPPAVFFDPWLISEAQRSRMQHELALREIAFEALPPHTQNPIDTVWAAQPPQSSSIASESVCVEGAARPARPANPLQIVPLSFAGVSWQHKVRRIQLTLRNAGLAGHLISALDDICWTLNLRGSDIAYNPVFFAYLFIEAAPNNQSGGQSVHLFINERQIPADSEIAQFLRVGGDGVELHNYERVADLLPELANRTCADAPVLVDELLCPAILVDRLRNRQRNSHSDTQSDTSSSQLIRFGQSPATHDKSYKCEEELAGIRRANLIDSVPLVQFFHWLEKRLSGGGGGHNESPDSKQEAEAETPPQQQIAHAHITEWEASRKLDEFRGGTENAREFRGLSFDSIVACGGNGAIVHYRAEQHASAPILPGQLLLVDSGGQYETGTTDITRTLHMIGQSGGRDGQSDGPTAKQRLAYTLVLRAHVNLAAQRFPHGTPIDALDKFARAPLWRHQLDYRHGTGHGVGAHLNVHEAPVYFSRSAATAGRRQAGRSGAGGGDATAASEEVVMQPGIVITIEPGVYLPGEFGVRLENIYEVVQVGGAFKQEEDEEQQEEASGYAAELGEMREALGGGKFLRFRAMAIFPFQMKLVDRALLSAAEWRWLEAYQLRCREELGAELRARNLTAEYDWLMRETQM